MKGLGNLTARNCKLFFKDKGIFFTSLVTPLILLLLYSTFLANTYRDSFSSSMPASFGVQDKLIDATVGGQLISSLLAVSCITVAFCSNMIMVQDKANGVRRDLTVSPVKSSVLAMSYYLATAVNTLIVCFIAMGAGFIYLANCGWYLSVSDVIFIILDVILLSLFGTALSSIINFFLSTQGQMSAVGTIISAGYGFICGAYMPISQFGEGLQKVLSFLPGTYGTSLIRNHCMRGVMQEMSDIGFPDEVIEGIRDSIDCNLYFFDNKVSCGAMFAFLGGSIAVLIAVYILMNIIASKKNVR